MHNWWFVIERLKTIFTERENVDYSLLSLPIKKNLDVSKLRTYLLMTKKKGGIEKLKEGRKHCGGKR